MGKVVYGPPERVWMNERGHYLNNAPPGALFAVGVYEAHMGTPIGSLLGLCVVGRPVARGLTQDGTWGEIVRMFLVAGLPHGTASAVLRTAAAVAKARGMTTLIAYHDRTKHTGTIYRKAEFKKDPAQTRTGTGWNSRPGRKSGELVRTPKRRWRLAL